MYIFYKFLGSHFLASEMNRILSDDRSRKVVAVKDAVVQLYKNERKT